MKIYQLCRELSQQGWKMYISLSWQDKKVIGDQFITATDSVGANFTEGYYRYHYLDKVKFCYQSRGSLGEAVEYWLELLNERRLINDTDYNAYCAIAKKISPMLNGYISSLYRSKSNI